MQMIGTLLFCRKHGKGEWTIATTKAAAAAAAASARSGCELHETAAAGIALNIYNVAIDTINCHNLCRHTLYAGDQMRDLEV